MYIWLYLGSLRCVPKPGWLLPWVDLETSNSPEAISDEESQSVSQSLEPAHLYKHGLNTDVLSIVEEFLT